MPVDIHRSSILMKVIQKIAPDEPHPKGLMGLMKQGILEVINGKLFSSYNMASTNIFFVILLQELLKKKCYTNLSNEFFNWCITSVYVNCYE